MDEKICNDCGKRVSAGANFCPHCKSQSFRSVSVPVKANTNATLLRLCYWKYNDGYVLAKSKLAGIFSFLFLIIMGITTNTAAGMIIIGIIISFLIFLIGFSIHKIREPLSRNKIKYNNYGLIPDLIHLFFFWQNKSSGDFVPSKTKIISFVIFVLFALLAAAFSAPNILAVFLMGLIFEIPAFAIGFAIHKLTNPNPKRQIKREPVREIPKPEKTQAKTEKPKEEVIPEFSDYLKKLKELKNVYQKKDASTRKLIEKRFEPPQLTYTRFISTVDKSGEMFAHQHDSAMSIISLASEESPRITRELDSKIDIMESLIDRLDDLANEIVVSMESSDSEDVSNLIDDMENLIKSVRDY